MVLTESENVEVKNEEAEDHAVPEEHAEEQHVHGPHCHHHDHGPSASAATRQVVREHRKIGRNDACICGSLLKFKKCCGK